MTTPTTLKVHGEHVNRFARTVPNLGRLGELTEAVLKMLTSNDWRDYRDATGAYHFYPGEFDYFLALQAVDARDVSRLYLTPPQRARLAVAMDRTREGDARYRRPLEAIAAAHPHAAQSLSDGWGRCGWGESKYPVGRRALTRAATKVSLEEHARQTRTKRLTQLRNGWRGRVDAVVAAARDLTREELRAAIDALKILARQAPKLPKPTETDAAARMRRLRAKHKTR